MLGMSLGRFIGHLAAMPLITGHRKHCVLWIPDGLEAKLMFMREVEKPD